MTHAHTDLSYDQELQELEKRVTAMGAEVCNMLDRALRALRAGDPRAAREVVVADNAVNRLEVEIDEMCLAILARRQPVASDLRFIATALKVDTDLERIGDLCVNLCERLLQLSGAPDGDTGAELVDMGVQVRMMIETALRAFVSRDVMLAETVLDADDVVDKAYADTGEELAAEMGHEVAAVHDGLRLRSMAKYLERMGDHATNIAEMVIFMVEGRDVRHPGRLGDRRAPN
jgi:phosphate transport system protein